MEFFDRFAALIIKPLGLRTEVFLQYKTVMDAQNIFQKTAFEFSPIAGLSRKPGGRSGTFGDGRSARSH